MSEIKPCPEFFTINNLSMVTPYAVQAQADVLFKELVKRNTVIQKLVEYLERIKEGPSPDEMAELSRLSEEAYYESLLDDAEAQADEALTYAKENLK